MYSFRFFNSIKRNYTTTKRKALTMVYALHKFKHHLLSNTFTFYINHMGLIYLVNKPHVYSKLTRWLLLFMEYNFKIIYKLSRSHLIVDALNRLPNHTEPIGVPNQTYDAPLLTLRLEWLQSVYAYMLKGVMPERFTMSCTLMSTPITITIITLITHNIKIP